VTTTERVVITGGPAWGHTCAIGRGSSLRQPSIPVRWNRLPSLPIQTLKVGALGTHNALGLAKAKRARFLLASTSEAYGDPLEHRQSENHWGNVNPIGPRGVYDEAKRFAEAMTMAYHGAQGLETRIARIFNTIGSRMRLDDGRAVPTFITQALRGQSLTVHGDGSHTRSVELRVRPRRRRRATSTEPGYRAGQPRQSGGDPSHRSREHDHPHRRLRFRSDVREASGGRSPGVRRPDITRARTLLGWEPQVGLEEALERTTAWFRTIV
jgi:dTDP-glucose 4,6-dehydratase